MVLKPHQKFTDQMAKFENDVNMYGTQALWMGKQRLGRLRMM